MLPPGIFLWETGFEDTILPTSLEDVAGSASSWREAIDDGAPWSECLEVEGIGCFRKASILCESTIVIVNECTSTMEAAKVLAQNNVLGEWGSVLAVQQTQGRGQLRRPWISSPGNLHASVVLPSLPKQGPWAEGLARLLPLVAGYIFAEAFSDLGANVQLKWPNDFLQSDRKIGGMLIEEKNDLVILGVGVNLVESPPDEKMREDRSVPAAVLQMEKPHLGPAPLWGSLVSRGKSVYVVLLDELEPSEFLSAMTNRLAWLGHRVRIHERESDVYYADIVGVSPLGGLVIRRDGRESVLFSGSIAPL